MRRLLLDTNICIAMIRDRNENVINRIRSCRRGEIGISVVTLAELNFGAEKSARPLQNRLAVAAFCAEVEVHPFDILAAKAYGEIRAALEKVGRPIGSLDTMIAAHGLALGATVVTNNQREFARVAGLEVENWL